jgi:hypothetical protein
MHNLSLSHQPHLNPKTKLSTTPTHAQETLTSKPLAAAPFFVVLAFGLAVVVELELLVEVVLFITGAPLTVVDPLTTTIVVPLITSVLPAIEKSGFTGIVVGPAIISSDVPSIMTVSSPPSFPVGVGEEMGMVVPEGITSIGVPLIVVVDAPLRPVGAPARGMVVPDGRTSIGVPFIVVVWNAGLEPGVT